MAKYSSSSSDPLAEYAAQTDWYVDINAGSNANSGKAASYI